MYTITLQVGPVHGTRGSKPVTMVTILHTEYQANTILSMHKISLMSAPQYLGPTVIQWMVAVV